jgi:RNA polymerase sigma-70 factor (ECF subfamily)
VIVARGYPHHEVMSSAAIRRAPCASDASPLESGDGARSGRDQHDERHDRDDASAQHEDAQARMRRMLDEQFDFIWRSLRRFGMPSDRVDDGAQQVFVIASRKLDVIQRGSERSFLFGTAMRVASDLRRSASYRREIAHPDPGAELEGGTRPDDLLDQQRARVALDALLDDMELELRSVFVLYEIEEMTTTEIAALLEIPAGTVASRLRRARDDFQAKVARLQKQSAFIERGGGR